jgi:spore coat protein U-like protein
MNILKSTLLATALATLGVSSAANAATANANFNVKLTITSSCTINTPAATDVDFGSHASTEANLIAAGQLNVNCTPGTSYSIALNDGQNAAGGGVTARKLAKGSDLVPYQLYSDSGRSTVWGSTSGTGGNTVGGTGTGAVQNVPVYGKVASANFPAGSYNDVVTATITY